MTVILILAGLIVGVGAILYIHHRMVWGGEDTDAADTAAPRDRGEEECCGMHITCEKDSLLASVSDKIEYYEDEELDRYAGRNADEYDTDEVEEFRDVLLTMQPADIAGWARSLQLRGIVLPADVREELLMIVGEARQAHTVLS